MTQDRPKGNMGRAKAGHEFDASWNSSSTHDVNITLTSLCGFVDPTSVVAMEMVVGLVVATARSMCRSRSLSTILNFRIQFEHTLNVAMEKPVALVAMVVVLIHMVVKQGF